MGGCSFYTKKKLKSEIFNGKNVYKQKYYLSVVTKSLNWEILTKTLVTERVTFLNGGWYPNAQYAKPPDLVDELSSYLVILHVFNQHKTIF